MQQKQVNGFLHRVYHTSFAELRQVELNQFLDGLQIASEGIELDPLAKPEWLEGIVQHALHARTGHHGFQLFY